MNFYEYLNDYQFWFAVLAVLIIYRVFSFVATNIIHDVYDYIKSIAIEEYKKNKGE